MELGYIPDFIGRSLSSRKTQTIGLVIPKIAHSFFSYSVERFYFYAKEQGYHLIPMVSFEDAENERDNIQTLLSMRVDGLIIDIAENSIEKTEDEDNIVKLNKVKNKKLNTKKYKEKDTIKKLESNEEENKKIAKKNKTKKTLKKTSPKKKRNSTKRKN